MKQGTHSLHDNLKSWMGLQRADFKSRPIHAEADDLSDIHGVGGSNKIEILGKILTK